MPYQHLVYLEKIKHGLSSEDLEKFEEFEKQNLQLF